MKYIPGKNEKCGPWDKDHVSELKAASSAGAE